MKTKLQTLKYQVNQWRQTRPNARGPVPEHLKNGVLNLLSDYSANYLASYLGFGNSTISQWQSSQVNGRCTDLVEINHDQLESPSHQEPLQIIIKRGDLEVQASMTVAQFSHIFLSAGGAIC